MKLGIILYHKDIYKIYQEAWVRKCLDSLKAQTVQDFTVYELCYSRDRQQLWPGSNFSHIPMPNHIFAQNHTLDKAFLDDCDVVANVNLDDAYSPKRLELQLKAVQEGYDLISTNFEHIEDINGVDTHVRNMIFHDRDLKYELGIDHNVLCHSVILYTKKFWEDHKYYNEDEVGFEDLTMWKKALANGCKIKILPEILCHYRLSDKQTSKIYNSKGVKVK